MAKQYKYIQEGLSDRKFRSIPWAIFTFAIVTAGSILFSINRFTVLGVNENLSELGADVFLKYLFIVVAVERAAAVFVGMFRSKNKVDWALRINRIGEILQKEDPPATVLKQVHARETRLIRQLIKGDVIGEIEDIPSQPTNEDYVGYLTSAKHAYEFQRARYNSTSNRYVARSVFFVGIILATLGLSIFNDLLQNMNMVSIMKDQISNGTLSESGLIWQTGLLRFSDIVITGGLLGGGSAGLNAIATKVTEFLNK